MLAVLGLLGIGLAASAFIDVSGKTAEDDDDLMPDMDEVTPEDDIGLAFLAAADSGVSNDAGAGQDAPTAIATTHSDSFLGTDADDIAEGMDGFDLMRGAAGDDQLHGGRGDDHILGGAGDDDLTGAVGDDQLFGEDGNDALLGGDGHDFLDGGAGDDTLNGSYGHDTLAGGAGADLLQGGAGNDVLDGGDDDVRDYLNGGNGDDTLIAGSHDNLNGGLGADTFVLDDVILVTVDDFNPDEDVIELAYEDTPPALSTEAASGGLNLIADGEVVATFPGLQALDITKSVKLIAA